MPELVEAETLDRSDEPRRADWPPIPKGNALGPWCYVAQSRFDDIADGQDRIERAVSRGGPATRIALALIDLAKHPNGKWYAMALLGLVAIAFGATIGFSGDGFTIGGTSAAAAQHTPAGPVPVPVEKQE